MLFAAVVLALGVAMRRLRHAAGVERADAILAAEVDALGDPRALAAVDASAAAAASRGDR